MWKCTSDRGRTGSPQTSFRSSPSDWPSSDIQQRWLSIGCPIPMTPISARAACISAIQKISGMLHSMTIAPEGWQSSHIISRPQETSLCVVRSQIEVILRGKPSDTCVCECRKRQQIIWRTDCSWRPSSKLSLPMGRSWSTWASPSRQAWLKLWLTRKCSLSEWRVGLILQRTLVSLGQPERSVRRILLSA